MSAKSFSHPETPKGAAGSAIPTAPPFIPALSVEHFRAADRLHELESLIDPKQESWIKERESLRALARMPYRDAPGHLRFTITGETGEIELLPAGKESKINTARAIRAFRAAKVALAEVLTTTLDKLKAHVPDKYGECVTEQQTGTRKLLVRARATDACPACAMTWTPAEEETEAAA